jgi:histidinol-phosphate aminotransferase
MNRAPAEFVRSTLLPLRAYGQISPSVKWRMHMNEAPEDLPDGVKSDALRRLRDADWSRYPEEGPAEVCQRLAGACGVSPERVLVGNGSNDVLQLLFWAALDPGDTLLVPQPTFSLYAHQARALGARVVEHELRPEGRGSGQPFRYDVERLCKEAHESRAKIVLAASPNNPTGTPLTAGEVRALHDALPDALLVVDEAYREFCAQDFAPLLAEAQRLVLMRTFSKAYAAAALRAGYVVCDAGLAGQLRKVQMPYNFGGAVSALALALMDRADVMKERVARVVAERERLLSRLREVHGVEAQPSGANFIYFETPRPARELHAAMLARGVLLRDCSRYRGCEHGLRVSVGRPEASDAFLAALSEEVR